MQERMWVNRKILEKLYPTNNSHITNDAWVINFLRQERWHEHLSKCFKSLRAEQTSLPPRILQYFDKLLKPENSGKTTVFRRYGRMPYANAVYGCTPEEISPLLSSLTSLLQTIEEHNQEEHQMLREEIADYKKILEQKIEANSKRMNAELCSLVREMKDFISVFDEFQQNCKKYETLKEKIGEKTEEEDEDSDE